MEVGLSGADDDAVDEEVVRVLTQALNENKVVETVDLSGRHLKFLPEPFGQIHSLLLLNVSINQLQVCILLINNFGFLFCNN